jgi:hypothetical protein
VNDNIKFWIAIGTVEQLDFEGHAHSADVPVGEAHIVYSEVLLCRQSRDRLKGDLKAKRQRTAVSRPANVKLCEKCAKKYKEHADLSWQKWANPPVLATPPAPRIKQELVQK